MAAVQLRFDWNEHPRAGRDSLLEAEGARLLASVGIDPSGLKVVWNPRLRSTAGRAFCRGRRDRSAGIGTVELNPLLRTLSPGETGRTLRHELAHLVARARHPNRRLDPHGREWRAACADLGIPGEAVTHALPLPRRAQARPYRYRCPGCAVEFDRARPLSRNAACGTCCNRHARGRYDARFRLERLVSREGVER
jgi:predicted SprT family Zn-dependent metalloprotease